MKLDKKGFDENKVYWKKLNMIGKTCEVNNEKFICMDDKLGVVSWVNCPLLIEEVENLRGKIEQLEKQIISMKSCHTCIYSDKTNFYNYKFKCNTCAGKCNWSNDFDSLEFLEAEDYEK